MAALGAVVLGLLLYGGISYRVADGVTKLERQPLVPAAESVGPIHEDVSFRARDGLLLKGWWFDPSAWQKTLGRPDRAVVFVHGRGQNRIISSSIRTSSPRSSWRAAGTYCPSTFPVMA